MVWFVQFRVQKLMLERQARVSWSATTPQYTNRTGHTHEFQVLQDVVQASLACWWVKHATQCVFGCYMFLVFCPVFSWICICSNGFTKGFYRAREDDGSKRC